MGVLETMLQNLVNMEFFQLLFPFLLALAIIYGLLRYALKDQLPKSAAGLISIIIAFFVMLFSSWNAWVYVFLTNISGVWLMIASVMLFLVLLLGIVGISFKDLTEKLWLKWLVALVIIFIIIMAFFGATTFGIPYWMAWNDFWTIIFFVVILAIVMYFFSKGEGGGAPEEKKK